MHWGSIIVAPGFTDPALFKTGGNPLWVQPHPRGCIYRRGQTRSVTKQAPHRDGRQINGLTISRPGHDSPMAMLCRGLLVSLGYRPCRVACADSQVPPAQSCEPASEIKSGGALLHPPSADGPARPRQFFPKAILHRPRHGRWLHRGHAKDDATGLIRHIVVAARILHLPHGRSASAPMPVSMMPNALRPTCWATDLNSTSTEGLWRLTGGSSLTTAT